MNHCIDIDFTETLMAPDCVERSVILANNQFPVINLNIMRNAHANTQT